VALHHGLPDPPPSFTARAGSPPMLVFGSRLGRRRVILFRAQSRSAAGVRAPRTARLTVLTRSDVFWFTCVARFFMNGGRSRHSTRFFPSGAPLFVVAGRPEILPHLLS